MTETGPAPVPPAQAGKVQATARLMRLEAGTYCIFHASGPASGAAGPLSGMRVSPPPGGSAVQVSTFEADGWIGARDGAALVRVPPPGGAVLVTTYHAEGAPDLPGLQVVRLSGTAPVRAGGPAVPAAPPVQAEAGSMVAHIQRQGDVSVPLGAWMGRNGSGQWLEGFEITPATGLAVGDIEYQAILGQDWYSPWVEGGQYCGSRGMALPLLGLRVRLKEDAARTFACRVEASFTDGTRMGPVEDEPLMAATQAPLESFRIEITPRTAEELPVPPDNAAEETLLAASADTRPAAGGRLRRGRRARPARRPAQPMVPDADGTQVRAVQEVAEDSPAPSPPRSTGPVPWWNRRPERSVATNGDAAADPAPGRRGKAPRRSRARADA